MGKQWVGFQTATKPAPGHVVCERDAFSADVSDAALVALVSTRAGLTQWLAPITTYSDRRGGSIDFVDGAGAFGGTFTLLEPPRQVVLITDRHGEIDIRVDVRPVPSRVSVTVTRFVADTEDADVVSAAMRDVITRLRQGCTRGR